MTSELVFCLPLKMLSWDKSRGVRVNIIINAYIKQATLQSGSLVTGEKTAIPVAPEVLFAITDFFFRSHSLYNKYVLLYLEIADTRILKKNRFTIIENKVL